MPDNHYSTALEHPTTSVAPRSLRKRPIEPHANSRSIRGVLIRHWELLPALLVQGLFRHLFAFRLHVLHDR